MTIHAKNHLPKRESNSNNLQPITAKDAYEQTNTFLELKKEEQLKQIFKEIHARIEQGYYYLDVFKRIDPCNRYILKEYGYVITDYQHDNGQLISSINWNKSCLY